MGQKTTKSFKSLDAYGCWIRKLTARGKLGQELGKIGAIRVCLDPTFKVGVIKK